MMIYDDWTIQKESWFSLIFHSYVKPLGAQVLLYTIRRGATRVPTKCTQVVILYGLNHPSMVSRTGPQPGLRGRKPNSKSRTPGGLVSKWEIPGISRCLLEKTRVCPHGVFTGVNLTVGTSAAQVPIFRSQSDQRHETPRPKHFCLGLRQLNYRIYRQFEPSTVRLGILSRLHHA